MVNRSIHGGANNAAQRPQYVPGRLVVKMNADVADEMAHVDIDPDHPSRASRSLRLPAAVAPSFARMTESNQIREVVPVFADAPTGEQPRASRAAIAVARSIREPRSEDLRGINIVELTVSADESNVIKQLEDNPGVQYVHRVPARWLAARKKTSTADPMTNRQWNLRAIKWFDLKPRPDARTVKVAVLDTGIDETHPDLKDLITYYAHRGVSALDIVGHGTHVAGIIAAAIHNNVGIAGICRCQLNIWKIFDDAPASDGEYYTDEILYLRALAAVRSHGMDVLNLSIGGTLATRTERDLYKRLIDAGIVVVAAMGNEYEDGNPKEYPAGYSNVIAVGATDESDRRAYFSNTGRHIALSAPGTGILSTLPMKKSGARPKKQDTEYAAWDGTSMAAPHVAAAAALLLAKSASMTVAQVRKKLTQSATKLTEAKSQVGAGLLNLEAALK